MYFTPDSVLCGVLVSNIIPGDLIGGATVQYVVKYEINAEVDICQIGYLGVAPNHPICVNGAWVPASKAVKPRKVFVKTVYNLVLNGKHIVRQGEIEAVTLAHNFSDPVRAHIYFGTHRCLSDILAVQVNGVAVFSNFTWTRNSKNEIVGVEHCI